MMAAADERHRERLVTATLQVDSTSSSGCLHVLSCCGGPTYSKSNIACAAASREDKNNCYVTLQFALSAIP